MGRKKVIRKIRTTISMNDICKNEDSCLAIHILPEELEALRLCDYEGFYQNKAAELMEISRATFQRILHSARKKVINAILSKKEIHIKNGLVVVGEGVKICPVHSLKKRFGKACNCKKEN